MKATIYILVIGLISIVTFNLLTIQEGSDISEIENKVKSSYGFSAFSEIVKNNYQRHLENVEKLEYDEYEKNISRLKILYQRYKDGDSENIGEIVEIIGYDNLYEFNDMVTSISRNFELIQEEVPSLKNMQDYEIQSLFARLLISETKIPSRGLVSVAMQSSPTCESQYGDCAESAILNFFGQTATCGAVLVTGGVVAGIICQVANEINLYTNLHNCETAYTNCSLQEA
jgi:hypothetical protein